MPPASSGRSPAERAQNHLHARRRDVHQRAAVRHCHASGGAPQDHLRAAVDRFPLIGNVKAMRHLLRTRSADGSLLKRGGNDVLTYEEYDTLIEQ